MKKLLEDFGWHLDRGKHNEIPTCCTVWFFIRSKVGWSYVIDYVAPYRWLWTKISISNYVRCPLCIFKGININVHECVPSCGWHYDTKLRAEAGYYDES